MMQRRLKKHIALFSCTAFALMAFVSAARAELVVPLNRSELLSYREDIQEVVIAAPEIADIVVHGTTRVSVIGKKIGKTSLRVFNTKGQLLTDTVVAVSYDLPEIRRALKNFFPHEQIGIELVNSNIAITGIITDAETSQRAVRIVEEYLSDDRTEEGKPYNVINLAKIRSGQQVMLRVRVGEMRRNVAKQLGLNIDAVKGMGDFSFSVESGVGEAGESIKRLGLDYNAGGASITGLLDALEKEGLYKNLAEPNLVAISGEKAEFLAGGEFPIPVSQRDGAISVQFREYGVGVQFTPFVLSPNRIRLVVQPEVSEIDRAVALSDGTPGLTSRRVKTTIELAPGESFVIAGLLQDLVQSQINELPGMAEIPILGSILRNTDYSREERELVIAVTPYLVDPVAGSDIRLPSDDFRPASLMESFFYGAMGSLTGDVLRISQTPSVEGPIGFMVD